MTAPQKSPSQTSTVYAKFNEYSFHVGRGLMSLFVSNLKDLSDEELASEPEYRNSLQMAGLSPVYLLLGLIGLVVQSRLDLNASDFLPSDLPLWISVAFVVLGLLLLLTSVLRFRLALQVRSRATSESDTKRAADPTFRDVERIRSERASLEERLFQRNLKDEFNLKTFEWQNVSIFEDGEYRFAPRVNVLLGKNGFGKTILFRSLVAMMQRDAEYSAMLFAKPSTSEPSPSDDQPARLRVQVTRNGNTEEIVRDDTYFDDPGTPTVGKIPILAIPDSRFITRTRRTVAGAASTSEPLASSGARNYLTQEPFENVVQDLLTQLCIDYFEPVGSPIARMKGFDRQIFRLVEEVVGELTENQEFHFQEISRAGNSAYEILVSTSGSQDNSIAIQSASQGTLSIVAIFGLIHSFLHSLRPQLSEDKIASVPAIVLIDEIDAHLHPSWQQKLLGMLTRKFPNVQFIVSAHSPAIVAGCDKGEVSVLRRNLEAGKFGKFYVDTLPEDFLGANVQDLYRRVFEIEDVDRLYLEFATLGSKGKEERERDIGRLEKKERRTPQEEKLLDQLLRESRLVRRADEAREQRLKLERTETQLAMLDIEIEKLRGNLKEKESEIERLTQSGPPAVEGDDANRLS